MRVLTSSWQRFRGSSLRLQIAVWILVVAAVGSAFARSESPPPRPSDDHPVGDPAPSYGAEDPGPTPRVRKTHRREPGSARTPPGRRPRVAGPAVFVSRVIDGDTIEVLSGGRTIDVRLIGIDTPETVHPTVGVECFGKAASAYTRRHLEGRRVRLEFDVERRDRYGRTLAYVHAGGVLFNRRILADGFAQVSTYPPNVRYVDRFLQAQRSARRRGAGLWRACSDGGGDSRGGGKPAPLAGRGCDANYRGACVPPYPPDIDCGDLATGDFRSVGSDPHGFDGDGDGAACEG